MLATMQQQQNQMTQMMVSLSQIFSSLFQQISNAQQPAQIPFVAATISNFDTAIAYLPNPYDAYSARNAVGTPMTPITYLLGRLNITRSRRLLKFIPCNSKYRP